MSRFVILLTALATPVVVGFSVWLTVRQSLGLAVGLMLIALAFAPLALVLHIRLSGLEPTVQLPWGYLAVISLALLAAQWMHAWIAGWAGSANMAIGGGLITWGVWLLTIPVALLIAFTSTLKFLALLGNAVGQALLPPRPPQPEDR